MKEILNINISGFPFTIDLDAYGMLKEYIEALSHIYKDEEPSKNFIEDIESRIAELLIEKLELSQSTIVTSAMISGVISRLGTPEEMMSLEGEAEMHQSSTFNSDNEDSGASQDVEETEHVNSQTYPGVEPPKMKKRLFRNPDNKMLGGVCGGIAAYLNVDPTWVRLISVALCFFSLSTVAVVYLVLWLVVPEARTPIEILQMKGESPTLQNIASAITQPKNGDENPNYSIDSHGFTDTILKILARICKVLLIIAAIIAVPIGIALIIGILGLLLALIVVTTGIGLNLFPEVMGSEFPEHMVILGIICAICWIVVIGIPCLSFILIGWHKVLGKPLRSKLWSGWMVGTWVVAFIAAGITSALIAFSAETQENVRRLEENVEEISKLDDSDSLKLDSINNDSIPSESPSMSSIKTTPSK